LNDTIQKGERAIKEEGISFEINLEGLEDSQDMKQLNKLNKR